MELLPQGIQAHIAIVGHAPYYSHRFETAEAFSAWADDERQRCVADGWV